jgi:hypothetical protein
VKRHAPAAERNRDPIAEVLAAELPHSGLVLEVASGTGEHAVHFARRFPQLQWQPSDPDRQARASIAEWREESGLPNLLPPIGLDASARSWAIARPDAIVCINMVHISPPEASEGLLAHAGLLLPEGAPLVLYGPYLEADVETSLSNMAFDASLKARDPSWGLRPVSWIDGLAEGNGLHRTRRVEMPANNLMLVYRRGA